MSRMLFTFCIIFYLNSVYPAKILGYFPMASWSHQVIFQTIWKELSLRGHQVTVITPIPINDTSLVNLTEIDVGFTHTLYGSGFQSIVGKSAINMLTEWFNKVIKDEENIFKSKEVQELLNNKSQHFDLFIFQWMSNIGLGFAGKYRIPSVGISSFYGSIPINDCLGNPNHPAINVESFSQIEGGDLNFYQRLQNTAFLIWFKIYINWFITPRHDKLIKKYFGDDLPYLEDLEKNVSLALLNTNYVVDYARPYVPAVINIGQIHIREAQPLPEDIKNYLDHSKKEVIYFSLGSNVRSSKSPEYFFNTVKAAISELPYNFIWKWELDEMPGKPKNVFTKKWFPQQDVLSNPKVKCFITQGGLNSMQEAMVKGVPMVIFPFIGDQLYNAKKISDMKIGLPLDPHSFTKEQFKNAVTKIIENKEYGNSIKKYRNLILDEPMTGLEKAIWWIEFTIRHKGDFNMKSKAIHLPYYQYLLLDVILFVLVLTFLLVYSLIKIITFINKIVKGYKIKVMFKYKNN